MSIDLSAISDLETFSAAIKGAADDAVMVVLPPSHISSFRQKVLKHGGWTKRQAKKKILGFIEEAVRARADIREDGEYLVKKVVEQLLFNHDIDSDSLLNVGSVRKILSTLPKDLQACGCCRRVYDQMDFQKGEEVKNVIRWLFGNPQIVGHKFTVFTTKLLRAAAVHKDDELLQQARDELELIGKRLFGELQSGQLTACEYRLTEILLGQILALYPFFEPKTGARLTLPQKIGDRWHLVTFLTEQIPLTPAWLGPPILAFGLLPVEGSVTGARPRLLFPGTSQPTASWSPLDTWADFVPGYSVGEFVFNHWAKEILKGWVEKRARERIEVTGISLGGSLTLLTVSHFPELVSIAKAFVPPAVRMEVVHQFEQKITTMDKSSWPKVSLFWQDGDFVSLIGTAWSKYWTAYQLIPAKHLDFISSHNKAFAAQPLTAVVRMDIEKDTKRLSRRLLNLGFKIVCIPVFCLLSVCIGVRAFVHLFRKKKKAIDS